MVVRLLQEAAFYRLPLRVALMRNVLKRMRGVSYAKRLYYNALVRPEYGYCMYNAALLAKALGYKEISAIEFGVAGGAGLVNIEQHAKEIKKELGVDFQIFGFDTGSGLPKPEDYRDMPYMWDEGFYPMDQQRLENRLESARLVIGDVRETTINFHGKYSPAPIGCIFFDLDYYSSTVGAFKIFDTDPAGYLPRVYCYFDDVLSEALRASSEYVGVLRAINEFNENSEDRKIAKIPGLAVSRKVPAYWNEAMYVFHDFVHPKYCDFIGNQHRNLPLD